MGTKICSWCKRDLDLSQFHKNGTGKNGKPYLRGRCISCLQEIDRQRYHNDPNRQVQWRTHVDRTNKIKMDAIIASGGCADCGVTDARVLEFDHLPGHDKKFNISGQQFGAKKLVEEIAKCEVVCANCHRIRTIERGNHWKSLAKQEVTTK